MPWGIKQQHNFETEININARRGFFSQNPPKGATDL